MWILASMAYAIVVAMILIQTRRPTLSLYFSLFLSISLFFSLSRSQTGLSFFHKNGRNQQTDTF